VARGISALDHRAWYELAARTQRLANFYGEKELKVLVQEARVRGFRAEESVLRPTQSAELLKLADRATDFGLDAEEARRMRHKALRWRLDALIQASADSNQWFELAETMARHLPGAGTPLTAADSAIVNQYRTKPVEVYDTMPKARSTYDRESWVDVTARALSLRSAEPDADLATLAKDAAKLLPERPELAQQILRKWAELEASRVASLPASHVRRLADTFRTELGDANRAHDILWQWLDTRRKRLGARDADGRVRLAKDFRADLKDNDAAAKLLLEAVQIESDLPEAAAELKALGYVKTANGWRTGNDPLVTASSPRSQSSRLPEKNMTAEQVRSILGEPRPGDRIRFAQRKNGRVQVIEQWTYRGPPDVFVAFQVVSETEARVIAINTPTQK
jgi:hypothetical protein